MATFLTTKKMSAALAARIESSVSGKKVEPGESRSLSPRVRGVVRLVAIAAVIAITWAFVSAKKRDRKSFDLDRDTLAETLRANVQSLTARQKDTVMHVETILVHFSGTYEGDLADPSAAKALDARLIYVRGPIETFTSTRRIAQAASSSRVDALAACLISPPVGRTERALLPSMRADAKVSNVSRLDDAEIALPFFDHVWLDRVRNAETESELAVYKHEVEKAGLERGKRALQSEYVVAVMDEAPPAGGITELDGEKPHDVRLAIVEIVTGKYLFRMRKHVDPSGWSETSRAQWASGLDGCRFAQDARAAMAAAP